MRDDEKPNRNKMPLGLGLKKIESSPFIEKARNTNEPSPMKEFWIEEEPSHLEQT